MFSSVELFIFQLGVCLSLPQEFENHAWFFPIFVGEILTPPLAVSPHFVKWYYVLLTVNEKKIERKDGECTLKTKRKNVNQVLVLWRLPFVLWYFYACQVLAWLWRRHHYRWKAVKCKPILCAQGLWAGRNLYPAIFAVTLTRSRFFRSHPHVITSYDSQEDVEDLF
jgi:hypothetical protein